MDLWDFVKCVVYAPERFYFKYITNCLHTYIVKYNKLAKNYNNTFW